jgi:hypothetical protein
MYRFVIHQVYTKPGFVAGTVSGGWAANRTFLSTDTTHVMKLGKRDTLLLPAEYNIIMVQILKNEGTNMKLILVTDQITMSEHDPDDDCTT